MEYAQDAERSQHHSHRRHAERILHLASFLPEDQRLLVEHVYRDGRPLSELARAAGVPAGRLRSRMRKTLKRMVMREFAFVAVRPELLPADTLRTARMLFLEGLSLRQAAADRGCSLHRVRIDLVRVQSLARLHAPKPSAA
jgi:DNA-directed RNA polymerase specialized sigma24 family protein